MAIPVIPNGIPPYTGPTGGDVSTSFLNAFFASSQSRRADQDQAMQMEQYQYDKTLRPLREQSMQLGLEGQKLGLDVTRQNMKFGAEDQTRQNEQFQYEKDVLRPLKEAAARNGLISQEYDIDNSRMTLEAKTAALATQMEANRAVENAMAGLAGFGQSIQNAPAEYPTKGKVTSYGYSSDPTGDSASLGTGAFKVPTGAWNNQLSKDSLAVSPDVERQFKAAGIKEGDMVHLRLADGTTVTRKWDDRTMQDTQATEKFGKPLTGRFDFYNSEGVHERDGHGVVGFSKANGKPDVTGMQAGPVQPVQIDQALRNYDTLVKSVEMLPPQSPARVRAEIAVATAQNDPVFSGLLKQREIQNQSREVGNVAATAIMAAPINTSLEFLKLHPQFVDYKVAPLPDGTFDIVRQVGGKQQAVSLAEKQTLLASMNAFSKQYDPTATATDISATVLKDYARYSSLVAAGDTVDPSDTSDEAVKVRRQAAGAKVAMQTIEKSNPHLAGILAEEKARAAAETGGVPEQDQQPEAPQPKPIPTRAQREKQVQSASKEELQNKAADIVAPKLQTIAPDNGKDSEKFNPAIQLAMDIYNDEEAVVDGQLIPYETSGFKETMTRTRTYRSAAEHALLSSDIKPSEEVIKGVVADEAAKVWAKRVLKKYGYDVDGKKAEAASPEQDAEMKKLIESFKGK